MEPGKFIVLEGIDGSGTTTGCKLLASYLFERDKRNVVVLTREPTKLSPEGQELRRRLERKLLPGEEKIDEPEYWADLFIKDRQWHLDYIVVPAVLYGQQVISDRHKLSTIAYQSAQAYRSARQAGQSVEQAEADQERRMDTLIRRHHGMYPADLTIILTVPIEIARQRGEQAGRKPEYFDNLELQQRVQENYLLAKEKLAAREHNPLERPEKIVILDGSGSMEEVAALIRKEVDELYGYAVGKTVEKK